MEIIRIGSDKLKLILSDIDVKKYKLCFESLNYDNTETRRILWQILDDAKKETGFDAASERSLVQAYPGRRGGCEIYVTRLAGRDTRSGARRLFRFEDMEELLRASCLLRARGGGEASALYELDGVYYLALSDKEEEKAKHPFAFMAEFSEPQPKEMYPYIKEDGTLVIAERAVERLARYAAEAMV